MVYCYWAYQRLNPCNPFMSRDYKHRANTRQSNRAPIWNWLIVGVLIALFVTFLSFLREKNTSQTQSIGKSLPSKAEKISNPSGEREKPEFQFYTILEKEQEVPDYELKIGKREEHLSRATPGRYELQAGSFRSFKEADKRKAQLALLGVEARIEKTKIGNRVWNRVKIGPFSTMTGVDNIRSRLRENRIDVVVLKSNIQ